MGKVHSPKRDAQYSRRRTHRNDSACMGNRVSFSPRTDHLHVLPSWIRYLLLLVIIVGAIGGIHWWKHSTQSPRWAGDEMGAGQGYASRMGASKTPAPVAGKPGEGIPSSGQTPESSTLLSEGNQLAKEGKFEEAIAKYNEELDRNPRNEDAFFNLGVAHARLRHYEEAVRSYQKALEIMPEYAEVHNNLGNVLAQLGRFDEATSHFETALKIMPDYASALNNLGTVYSRQKRIPEAIERFQQAIKSLPTYMEAHFNLANGLVSLRRYDEAETELKKVFELSPGFEPAVRLQDRLKALRGGRMPMPAGMALEGKP